MNGSHITIRRNGASVLMLWLLVVLVIAAPIGANATEDATVAMPSIAYPTVVLLAFENFTRSARPVELFEPLIIERVSAMPLNLVSVEELRPVLRKHRIRAVGGIGRVGMQMLHDEFDADYVLTGSYDIFVQNSLSSELGLSLRLIDVRSHRVVWARSSGATGLDYERILGLGRVVAIEELARKVSDEALRGLREVLEDPPPDPPADAPCVAVVPFDDILVDFPGGGLVTTQVVTNLVNRGFNTLEPGVVRELFITYQRFSRGGIDYDVLDALHDSLGVTSVVTGSVDGLHLGIPELELSFPEVSVSGRCIDAGSKSIVSMALVSKSGDHELLVGLGHTRAANDLIEETTSAMLNKLKLKRGYWHGR
ncbi:MAG: hypothetical protein Kow0074_03030 [Candidatus Zixiibacteriota bacterium]